MKFVFLLPSCSLILFLTIKVLLGYLINNTPRYYENSSPPRTACRALYPHFGRYYYGSLSGFYQNCWGRKRGSSKFGQTGDWRRGAENFGFRSWLDSAGNVMSFLVVTLCRSLQINKVCASLSHPLDRTRTE